MPMGVITPIRRHDKMLTRRASTRQRTEDSDCYEQRDDDAGQQTNALSTLNEHSTSNGPSVVPSPMHNNNNSSTHSGANISSCNNTPSHHHHQRRRRRQPNRQQRGLSSATAQAAWRFLTRGMAVMLVVSMVTGSLLWVRDATSDPFWRRSTIIVEEQELQNPSFELSSRDAPTSCYRNGNGQDANVLQDKDVGFTLVTQVSADRLWMMEHHCQRWSSNGDGIHNMTAGLPSYPMSIAVYTSDTIEHVQQQLQDLGCNLKDIAVQVLDAKLYHSDNYPVNVLRNMALRKVQTSHVVFIDIDFWISHELTLALHDPEVLQLLATDPKATLVLPAFMLLRQCKEWRVRTRLCLCFLLPGCLTVFDVALFCFRSKQHSRSYKSTILLMNLMISCYYYYYYYFWNNRSAPREMFTKCLVT